jgi:hypothetical protein
MDYVGFSRATQFPLRYARCHLPAIPSHCAPTPPASPLTPLPASRGHGRKIAPRILRPSAQPPLLGHTSHTPPHARKLARGGQHAPLPPPLLHAPRAFFTRIGERRRDSMRASRKGHRARGRRRPACPSRSGAPCGQSKARGEGEVEWGAGECGASDTLATRVGEGVRYAVCGERNAGGRGSAGRGRRKRRRVSERGAAGNAGGRG